MIIISLGLGYFLGQSNPEAANIIPINEGGADEFIIYMNFIPLIVAIFLGKAFSVVLERTLTSIKVIYFTIFYTEITHPDNIMVELQDELVDYLKMEGVSDVELTDEEEEEEEENETGSKEDDIN